MKLSIRKGFSYGLTSGIITTLGLMVGLNSGTGSKAVVLGGILTIAVADSLSDALGIHISEESENHHSSKEIWEATVSTFLSKFVFALIFVIPVLLFSLTTAVITSIAIGLLLLALLSCKMAKDQKINPARVIFEHLLIAVIVVILSYMIGNFISSVFS
ncbi:MAG: hypothetical protein V1659_01075 [Candidatus Woesearchaeota archaeon]